MGQVAVYSEVERRRRWSDDERLQILGEAFSPGAVVTQVAAVRYLDRADLHMAAQAA
jgi:hypothetical protein